MEQTGTTRPHLFDQLEELLDAARFSLETVRMALTIGRRSKAAFLTLEERLTSDDEEERETGLVALEALDHARGAFLDLADVLDCPERDGIGLEIRFWTTFEWLWHRLFTESVRSTGQSSLRHELVEAGVRTVDLLHELHVRRDERRLPA